jgi:hypothetical protein
MAGLIPIRIIMLATLFLLIPTAFCEAETAGATPNRGSGTPDDPYLVPKTALEIKIDGRLEEDEWADALSLELKYEVNPGENTEAPVRSEVLILYSSDCVYFGFRCHDPNPAAIRAHLSDRDSSDGDDHVAVILDTFNDERNSFTFLANPLGIQTDWITSDTPIPNYSWDAIWDSAGRITADGYTVEIAIPYSCLRFQRTDENQVWGLDVVRYYPRNKGVEIGLFPRDRNNDCYLCQAVKIQGFQGANPGRNFEIDPTLTAVRTDQRSDFPEGDFENLNREVEVGLTTKWGITPNLTFNGTLNPDFSQVEADALQLDINQPFALYFQEKRPFFTEGSDYFRTPLNAVYTRTMRDPVWGLKLTGKEGANLLGAYVVRDNITNLVFPGAHGSRSASLFLENTSAVVRFRRDIWNNSSVGLLLTDREGGDYFNRLLGVDGNFRLTERQRIRFQLLGSSTDYPEQLAAGYGQPLEDFSGAAINLRYSYSTRALFFFADYLDIGTDFRADLGYLPRVDYKKIEFGTGYTWWSPSKAVIHRFQIRAYGSQMSEQDGDLVYRDISGAVILEGPLQTLFAMWPSTARRVYQGIEFDQKSVSFDFDIQPSGDINFYLGAGFGDAIDYAHARAGTEAYLGPVLTVNIGRNLKAALNYQFSRLSVDGGRLYLANLADTTFIYQFNRRTFLRAIVQYSDIRRNTGLYAFAVDRRSNDLFTQLLFSYKINPRTVLFIGYSDNYFGNQDISLTQNDRTFFVKLGYAWVL